MSLDNFLTVDDQSISLRQALAYLRASGDLEQFLTRILRQYVIEQELSKRTDLEADSSEVEQAIINFRLQNQLVPADRFDEWLKSRGLNYTGFREQVGAGLKMERLKQQVSQTPATEFFEKNKAQFEQVVLSRIVVADAALAADLKRQLGESQAGFEELAKQHSLTSDRAYNGMMGTFAVGQLPKPVGEAIAGAAPGDVVGPLELEGRYTLLRIEQRLPASFEGQLKQNLENQMFDQWWQEQLKDKAVKMTIE